MKIRWFTRLPKAAAARMTLKDTTVVRSFFDPPSTIYVNRLMKTQPARLKYDLAHYIGHKVLHDGDGVKSVITTGPLAARDTRDRMLDIDTSSAVDSKDIVHAWRDFECSFFAGALLCPKVPFRRLLEQSAHDTSVAEAIEVTTAVAMRRMTAVSSYPHWHYFDAYPPGQLHAVYRGNGIPLPWGNMRLVQDPCRHWAVFRMIDSGDDRPSAQISVLDVGAEPRIYCCESVNVEDLSGKGHVVCAGIDVNPALSAQGGDAVAIAGALKAACVENGGSVAIPPDIKGELRQVAKLLNIAWLDRGHRDRGAADLPAKRRVPAHAELPRGCVTSGWRRRDRRHAAREAGGTSGRRTCRSHASALARPDRVSRGRAPPTRRRRRTRSTRARARPDSSSRAPPR